MLDTINLERKGIPAAVVAADKLLDTVGKGMARAQGYASLSAAVFPYLQSELSSTATDEDVHARAVALAPQIALILTGNT